MESSRAPAASIRSRTPSPLWMLRLSIATTSPGRSLGQRHSSRKARKTSVSVALDRHRGQHTLVVHRAQNRHHLPVPTGNRVRHPLAPPGTAMGACPLRRNATFIQINQPFRRYLPQLVDKRLTPPTVLFGVTLDRVERPFLSPRPICRTTRQRWGTLVRKPVEASSFACSSCAPGPLTADAARHCRQSARAWYDPLLY